ncbi:hypothetical protein KIPB_011605, partial [Kipferlia bialata]
KTSIRQNTSVRERIRESESELKERNRRKDLSQQRESQAASKAELRRLGSRANKAQSEAQKLAQKEQELIRRVQQMRMKQREAYSELENVLQSP